MCGGCRMEGGFVEGGRAEGEGWMRVGYRVTFWGGGGAELGLGCCRGCGGCRTRPRGFGNLGGIEAQALWV